MPDIQNRDIRVYDDPEQGRYIHVGDLIELFEVNQANAEPIAALFMPKVVILLRSLQGAPGRDMVR